VLADLDGRIDLVIDGGATAVGLESTIIACVDGKSTLLRPGGLSRSAIETVLGASLDAAGEREGRQDAPIAPGQLASHYAPRTPLRLGAHNVQPGEALLAFGHELPPGVAMALGVLNLSARGDLIEAAANLFAHLRALDRLGATAIAVMPVPNVELGEAINDRLRRAGALR
jgi:L-threonylcarbamoyladenylate synthase